MKKWYYLILTGFLSILEISFFPFVSNSVPALGLLLAVLAGLKVTPKFGLATGALGGLVIDVSLGFALPQMTLTYSIIGYVTGLLSGQLIDLGLFTYLLALLVASGFSVLSATFFALAFNYNGWQFVLSLRSVGMTLFINLLSGIVIYLLLIRYMPKDE